MEESFLQQSFNWAFLSFAWNLGALGPPILGATTTPESEAREGSIAGVVSSSDH